MPFYIEVKDKRILIVGGGAEGARRAAKYVKAGATVTVVAQAFSTALQRLIDKGIVEAAKVDVSDNQLVKRFVDNSDLIIVALDTRNHNDALVDVARNSHKFINLNNDSASTEVIIPVENQVHGIRLAATSEGKSVHVTREALQRAVDFLQKQDDLWCLLD